MQEFPIRSVVGVIGVAAFADGREDDNVERLATPEFETMLKNEMAHTAHWGRPLQL